MSPKRISNLGRVAKENLNENTVQGRLQRGCNYQFPSMLLRFIVCKEKTTWKNDLLGIY